jgi:hypothetical protein
MTAYVVSGYGQAHAAGYDVDSGSLSQRGRLPACGAPRIIPDMRADLRAYVVYALELNSAAAS